MTGKSCQKELESHIKKGLTKHAALNEKMGAGTVPTGKKRKKTRKV